MKFSIIAAAAVFAVASVSSADAATYTFNFYGNGLGGNVGPSKVFDDTTGTKSLTAYAINTEDSGAQLYQGPIGIGVSSSKFDNPEIDNRGDDEAIVFDLGSFFIPNSARLSLVSDGGWFTDPDEYQIWGSNDVGVLSCNNSGGLGCITSISTALVTGSGGGSGLLDILDINFGTAGAYQYIIATVPGGSGDDYKFKQLIVSEVPLPAAGWLLLAGLGGLAAYGRKKRAA